MEFWVLLIIQQNIYDAPDKDKEEQMRLLESISCFVWLDCYNHKDEPVKRRFSSSLVQGNSVFLHINLTTQ